MRRWTYLGQFHPRHRICRIDAERLIEQRHALVDFIGPASLRPPSRGQIELVGVHVARATDVRKPRRGTQPHAQHGQQCLRHQIRDLILHVEYARELLVEPAAPGGDTIGGMQQAGRGTHQIAASLQRSIDDPSHFEFPCGTHRVLHGTGVALHRAGRAHNQPGYRG
ncbi:MULTISPECIES: hypothetical protein [unclassified Variovorax]|uniref:hypothetical protein n=1 Tax=unclassified Variovorax TaxID=663243 RepID=UPI003ECD629C